jgi:ATP-dependent exoDNAse (exonuclease V) alpha subunit
MRCRKRVSRKDEEPQSEASVRSLEPQDKATLAARKITSAFLSGKELIPPSGGIGNVARPVEHFRVATGSVIGSLQLKLDAKRFIRGR